MKIVDRNVWVALGIVVVLGLAYLAVVSSGEQRLPGEGSFQVGPVNDPERIEISPPPGDDVPELIVLQREDDRWWVRRPVEAEANRQVAESFEQLFAAPLRADDLQYGPQQAESLGLSEEGAVHLAVFGVGDDSPSVELLVGEQLEAAGTGAQRTFVKEPGSSQLYRMQAGFGHLVRFPVEELIEGQRDE